MSTSPLSLNVRRGALALVLMGGLVGASFAQSADTTQQPQTRAAVRADLVRVEQAGYNPAHANPNDYPQDVQAAEAKVNGTAQQPKTRAQVRAELVRLEQAGYNPATANPYDYPRNIQAAEAKVAREDAQRAAQ